METDFLKAQPDEWLEVRDFYWTNIELMKDAPYTAGWKKGIYPDDESIISSVNAGTLYILRERDGGRIVAAMTLNHEVTDGYEKAPWPIAAEGEEVLLIHALGTHPEVQRQGLATKMVREAIRIAREMGCKVIRLDVLSTNLSAHRLYSKIGFVPVSTLQLFYEDTGLTDYTLYEFELNSGVTAEEADS